MANLSAVSSIRLYVTSNLSFDTTIDLNTKQVHYLKNVMRLAPGDGLLVFNGREGEWRATVTAWGRRDGTLRVASLERSQTTESDLWLVFTPLKKARLDVLIEKAGELGAGRLVPVLTERTTVREINVGRAEALVIEAAEQCGRMTLPTVDPIAPLNEVLARWPADRQLLFCDESGVGAPIANALVDEVPGAWAVLIGPEGGFSSSERAAIAAKPFALPVALGPRVLRADTAAIVALTMLQAHLGDWQ